VPALDELLVIWAQPFPNILKSFVNSLPVEMAVKLAFIPSRREMTKSPACVVVTAAPGVLLEVTCPMAVFVESGGRDKTPDTSQTEISTEVGALTKVGVTTVAPATEFSAYQISTEATPLAARAPAET
jgi:hypothetical protein